MHLKDNDSFATITTTLVRDIDTASCRNRLLGALIVVNVENNNRRVSSQLTSIISLTLSSASASKYATNMPCLILFLS